MNYATVTSIPEQEAVREDIDDVLDWASEEEYEATLSMYTKLLEKHPQSAGGLHHPLLQRALRGKSIDVRELMDDDLLEAVASIIAQIAPGFSLKGLNEYLRKNGRSGPELTLYLKEAQLRHQIETDQLQVKDLYDPEALNIALQIIQENHPDFEPTTDIADKLLHGCYADSLQEVVERLKERSQHKTEHQKERGVL